MRARVFLAAALFAALAAAPCDAGIRWLKTYEDALAFAKQTGQPMVVAFVAQGQHAVKPLQESFGKEDLARYHHMFAFVCIEAEVKDNVASHPLFVKYKPPEKFTLPLVFFADASEKTLLPLPLVGQKKTSDLDFSMRIALRKHGPVANPKQVREAIATLKRADALYEKDQYGAAAKLYQSIIDLGLNIASAAAAKEKLAKIEEYAKKLLTEARDAVADKAYPEAAQKLVGLVRNYPAFKAGQDARGELAKLRQVPEAKDAIAEAEKAEPEKPDKTKAEPEAVATKERPEADDRYNVFTEGELDALDEMAGQEKPKAEPKPAAGAAPECRRLLGLAQNWISNNQPEKAKPLLRRIIEKYPNTIFADQAKAILGKIE
jgi:tetratricopeptide (TPR) repeat protein